MAQISGKESVLIVKVEDHKHYLVYQDRISENLYRILEDEKPFALSWSHYVKLMRIEDESARKFYEIQTI